MGGKMENNRATANLVRIIRASGAAAVLFFFTHSSKARSEYVDLVQIGKQAQIRTTYHTKNNIMITAQAGTKDQLGLLYGVKENEFLFAVGAITDVGNNKFGGSSAGHLLQLEYEPRKMRFTFGATHTKEVITFTVGYKWAKSFGFIAGFDSNNKITIGLRKWID